MHTPTETRSMAFSPPATYTDRSTTAAYEVTADFRG
jgi:hypothetical protein